MNQHTTPTAALVHPLPPAPVLASNTRTLLPSVRAALRDIGFDEANIRKRLGYRWVIPLAEDLENLDTPYVPTDAPPVLDMMIKLFMLGEPVAVDPLRAGLTPQVWRFLTDTGMIAVEDGDVFANVYMMSWKGVWITADLPRHQSVQNAVFIPDQSAVMMSDMLAPQAGEPCQTMLDIGTGSGVLALLASRHFEQVTAVDINPRAVAFAALNAALNDVDLQARVMTIQDMAQQPTRHDLVSFAMPLIYPYFRRGTSALHTRSATGERLLSEAYGALDALVTPEGRAVYWHQVLIQPEAYFVKMLDADICLDGFDIVSNQFNLGSDRWSFSRTFLSRSQTPHFQVVCAATNPLQHFQSRADIQNLSASTTTLAKNGLSSSDVLHRYAYVDISQLWPAVNGKLSHTPTQMVCDTEVCAATAKLMRVLDFPTSVSAACEALNDEGITTDQGLETIAQSIRKGFCFLQ